MPREKRIRQSRDKDIINCVKQYACLYDIDDQDYYNFTVKEGAWKAIGKQLKEKGGALKIRWNQLRDAYRKYLKNTIKSSAKAKKNGRRRHWAYEEEISFIRDYIKDDLVQQDNPCDDNNNSDQDEEESDSWGDIEILPMDIVQTSLSTNREERRNAQGKQIDDVKLISCVQKHTSIYDMNDKDYKTLALREEIWKEIGQQLNEKGEVLKRRWNQLRDSYRKHVKRQKTLAANNKKPWKYEREIFFLNDHLGEDRPRHRDGNTSDEEQEESDLLEEDGVEAEAALDGEPVEVVESGGDDSETLSALQTRSSNTNREEEKKAQFKMIDDAKLISCVQQYTYLYDMNHKYYNTLPVKEEAWKEIGQQLNEKGDALKIRWSQLRCSYRKHVNKLKKTRGPGTKNKRPWKFEQEMSFLNDHLIEGRPRMYLDDSCTPPSSEEEQEESDMLVEDGVKAVLDGETSDAAEPGVDDIQILPAMQTRSSTNREKRKKAQYPLLEHYLKRKEKPKNLPGGIPPVEIPPVARNRGDHLTSYFKAVEDTVRTFDPLMQVEVKGKISAILSEYELKHVLANMRETTSPGKSKFNGTRNK